MFSTPSRKIKIFSDQENKFTAVPKSVGKDTGTKSACRTPLADLNGARPLSRQRLKDATIKEERFVTPKRSSSQRDTTGLKHVTVQQTQSEADVRAEEHIAPQKRDLSETEVGNLPSAIPVRATLRVPAPLSATQIAALMSPSVEPITEASSSVIPLTLFEPRVRSVDDEADVSLLAEEIVGEAIKHAERAVASEVKGDDSCSSPEVETTSVIDPPSVCLTEISDELSPSNDVANISIGDISPVRTMEDFYCSPISGGSLVYSSPVVNSDKEVSKTSGDSGLSIDSSEAMTSTEEISLDSFLSFRDDSCAEEKSENIFLSLTPSKLLQNAPKIVVPFPLSDVPSEGRLDGLSKSEYDIAQSVTNLWNAHGSPAGAGAIGTSSRETETDWQPMNASVGGGMATTLETSTCMTPCGSQECGTSPVSTIDQLTSPMPTSTTHSGTAMSPIILLSRETETDRPSLKDTGVGNSAPAMSTMSTAMTPCKSQECGTSPVATSNQLTSPMPTSCTHAGTAMSPVNLHSKETETDRPSLKDTGVGDSMAATLEMSTEMTPCKSQECGTSPVATSSQLTSPMPLSLADAETATTPVQCMSRETETSPMIAVDVETSTTPITVSPVRLSSFSRTSANSVALMEQMKSSHISNKLLRREVSTLKQTHTKWEEHLRQEQLEMKRKMSMMTREKTALQDSRVTAKAAAQREIDDLLAQVGQQLGQIADLEGTLKKRDEDVADLERQNSERKAKYCSEIKELQEDLCMAYKQHEAEISRLRGEFEKQSCYERLYHEAVTRNRDLEEEMSVYGGLEAVVQRTAKLQERMPMLQSTVAAVRTLFQRTLKEKEKLAQQRNDLAAKEESMNREGELRSEEHARLVGEMAELREAVDGERKKTMFAETEVERLQEELLTEQQERKNLDQSLQKAVIDVAGLTAERDRLLKKIEELAEAEEEQERNWEEERGRLLAEVDEMREGNKKLTEERDGLLGEMDPLKEKLTMALKRASEAEEGIKKIHESKEFVDQERESLEEYSKDMECKVATLQKTISGYRSSLEDAAKKIQQYEHTVQEIREHLKSSQSELEHTRQRAHHIIMHQGAQISSASSALSELISRVDQFSLEVTSDQAKSQHPPAEGIFLSGHQSSFVFSILNSPTPNDGDSGDTSSGPHSLERTPGMVPGASAFSRVTPARPAPPPEPERSIAELVQQSNDVFNQLFERVTEKLRDQERTVHNLLAKSKDLETDFQKAKRHHSSQLEHVQQELKSSDEHIRQLKQELRLALSRMYNQQDNPKMAPEVDRLSNQSQKELERLREEQRQSKQEIGAYQEHIATLTGILVAKPDPGQRMALLTQLSADNAQLKRKLRNFEGN